LSRLIARAPLDFGLRQISERLGAASAGKAQGACGGCDNCGSEQTPAQQAAQNLLQSEVHVPVAKIGLRADARRAHAGERGA
jgi:Fe-S cluster biogenesis protein NfuA